MIVKTALLDATRVAQSRCQQHEPDDDYQWHYFLLGGTIFSYFALNNVQDEIAAQSADIVTYRAPSYGLFRTDLTTSYWFGLPRDVSFSGLVMDVDLVPHQTVDYTKSSILTSSTLAMAL